jgi:peptidoglycan biosynthesis protein MviN/MurJ (putative lipid II flippase)
MGYRGLALGTAAAAMFNATALLWLLRGPLGGIDGRRIGTAFGKILSASALMGAAAWGVVTPSGLCGRAECSYAPTWTCGCASGSWR